MKQILVGRGDVAWQMATTADYPGWGYMVNSGATTIWELWNGDTANPAMNSGNYVMLLGDLLPWAYECLGGISSDPQQPGFRHIVMRPDFNITALRGVSAEHSSPYGVILSKWKRTENKIQWDITIPANCTATLHLADGQTKEIGSGEHSITTYQKQKNE